MVVWVIPIWAFRSLLWRRAVLNISHGLGCSVTLNMAPNMVALVFIPRVTEGIIRHLTLSLKSYVTFFVLFELPYMPILLVVRLCCQIKPVSYVMLNTDTRIPSSVPLEFIPVGTSLTYRVSHHDETGAQFDYTDSQHHRFYANRCASIYYYRILILGHHCLINTQFV